MSVEVYTPDDDSTDSSETGIVSEQVMTLANSILSELQRVMDTYAVEAHDFTQLTSLITSALEELDFSLNEKGKASVQLEQMELEMTQLLQRLNEERESRQATDERYISLEDSYGTESRKFLSQLQQLQNESKQMTSKLKIKADHVTRLEEERDDINRRYKEQHSKHSEDVSRYMRKIEQLQATEDALRQRTASIVQRRIRSSSVLSSSSQSKVDGAISQKSREQPSVATDNTTNQTKQTEDGDSVEKPDGLDIPSSTTTQDGKQETISPTSDVLSVSLPVGSAPGTVTDNMGDIESRLKKMDEEDEELYSVQQMGEGDMTRNASSLSEEISLGEEMELISPHVEQIKHLMSDQQLLESERQKLSSEKGSLTVQVEELQSDVVKLKTEIQMKEANEQVLEQCIEHLKGELRKYKEAERKMSTDEADSAKKKGVLRYTKTELDSVLRQYHFYKEKCHDLQDELQRARSAAVASAHRQQSGIRKLLSRLFSKLSGSSSPSPRRADRTPLSPRANPSIHQKQRENLKRLSASMSGSKTLIDPDSFVITNSWKVGHGGIIDPAAHPLPMYHSAVPVPEAGVLLQSAVSVCCPGQPVSSVSELKTVQHRLFIWICTFNRDEASQIHVVDVTVPVHAKVTETFVVSDSNVPAMAFVPTVAAKDRTEENTNAETAAPDKIQGTDASDDSPSRGNTGSHKTSSLSITSQVDFHPLMPARLIDSSSGHVASTFYHSSVWVGTEAGWIYIYSTISDPGRQLLVQDMDHPVQCIRFLFDSVFVGTGDGALAAFKPSSTACCGWDLPNHKRIPLDSKSAVIRSTCIEAVDDQLWVGCGNMINIVDPGTFVLGTSFSIRNRSSTDVSGICCVDDVVCVSMHRSPQLFLLHAHSTQLLQEIDITPMCSLIDCEPPGPLHHSCVNCMVAVNQQVWIGTASGVVMILRFENAKLGHSNSRHADIHVSARHATTSAPGANPNTLDPRLGRTASLPPICSYEDARMSCFGHLNGVRCLLAIHAEDILKCTIRDIAGSFESDEVKEFSWMFSGGYGFVDLQLKDADERRNRRRLSGSAPISKMPPPTAISSSQKLRGYYPDSRYDSQQFLFWKL